MSCMKADSKSEPTSFTVTVAAFVASSDEVLVGKFFTILLRERKDSIVKKQQNSEAL